MRLQVQTQWNRTQQKAQVMTGEKRNKSPSPTLHSSISQDLQSSCTVSPRLLEREYLPRISLEDELDTFKGILVAEVVDNEDDMFMSNEMDDLFYKVPKRMLSFIDGCPSMVTEMDISFDEENERVIFQANVPEEDKDRFTISFPIEKLFKLMSVEGLSNEDIEDTLFAMNDRQSIIVRAVSVYLRKNVRI
mmetsp:Transcript_18672/g.23299  ORF Transcript_18672/g.23299 Transcript_18672/m.23299 type:complete len:191 (-) Transcript_18672:839-1411(-)|eukprot:CAMPEP_0170451022 /NCGR_PEP_ID=MMETSP0123-20130129/384_1 /TAXON_ID=182087 /ORGANISM="Favella ehrenbergii, Strain Fehren 1" /LENGTH=190 /DNA_ID=CAMNT_0010712539 /DNA_START=1105 /DNA_END=1677 /DNA_ORIENTATION=+